MRGFRCDLVLQKSFKRTFLTHYKPQIGYKIRRKHYITFIRSIQILLRNIRILCIALKWIIWVVVFGEIWGLVFDIVELGSENLFELGYVTINFIALIWNLNIE